MTVDILLGGVVFEVGEVLGAGHQWVLAQPVGDGLGRLGGLLHAQLQVFGSGLIWGDGVILGYGLYPALLRQVRQ